MERRRVRREHIRHINSPSDKDFIWAEDAISRYREMNKPELVPVSGEFRELVAVADDYVEAEMRRLGLEPDEEMDGRDAYIGEIGEGPESADASMHALSDTTAFKAHVFDMPRWKQLWMVLHERVHMHSYKRMDYDHETGLINSDARIGVAIVLDDGKRGVRRFSGLLEALTDQAAVDLLVRMSESDPALAAELGESEDAQQVIRANADRVDHDEAYWEDRYYQDFIKIINTIMHRIADATDRPMSDIKDQWRRSLFTGELMHFRAVDEVYGPGSLRYLAALMNDGTKGSIDQNDEIDAMVEYFSTDDHSVHAQIAKKTLNPTEREAWLRANGYFKK